MTIKELIQYCENAGLHEIKSEGKGLTYNAYKPRKITNEDTGVKEYNSERFFSKPNGKNSAWSNATYIIVNIPDDYHPITNDEILSEWKTFRTDLPNQLIVLFDDTTTEWTVYNKSLTALGNITEVLSPMVNAGTKPLPIQVIFFGAPGTGKSHSIDDNPVIKSLPKENKVRTIFHPESDFASFVGCYKPVMEKPESAGKMAPVGKPVSDREFECAAADDSSSVDSREHYLPLYLFSHNDCLNLEDDVKIRREEITYKFTPQAFTNAYVQAWKEFFSAPEGNLPNNVYLIIEEINRGNCAQIFGNLFQLLDRDEEKFSKYAIDAEYDLRKYLNDALTDKTGNKLADVFSGNSDFNTWKTNNDKESIVKGETLCLPPNLYIVASMNTSDQGLFPMDSAFKRRWQWQYIPIKNEGKGHKIVLDKIEDVSTGIQSTSVGATLPIEYDWWSFLENVNFKIEDANSSSDKKLGYWFVKPIVKGSTEIDIETFTCKVVSYLWNDVFKNVPEGDLNIFTFEYLGDAKDPRTKRETHPFDSFFDSATGLIDTQMVKDFLKQDKMNILETTAPATPQNAPLGDSDTGAEQTENGDSEQELSEDAPQVKEYVEGAADQQ